MSCTLLADTILIAHFGFVSFVVLGFALVVMGGLLGWQWVRNRSFRLLHLAAILAVAVEAVVGIACPLTVWENALRGPIAAPEDFVPRWVARLLYYDFPPWVFTSVYVLFAAAVAAAWHFVPPAPRKRR